jgi:hypothetical protein
MCACVLYAVIGAAPSVAALGRAAGTAAAAALPTLLGEESQQTLTCAQHGTSSSSEQQQGRRLANIGAMLLQRLAALALSLEAEVTRR